MILNSNNVYSSEPIKGVFFSQKHDILLLNIKYFPFLDCNRMVELTDISCQEFTLPSPLAWFRMSFWAIYIFARSVFTDFIKVLFNTLVSILASPLSL